MSVDRTENLENKKTIDEFLAGRKEAGKRLDPDSPEIKFTSLYTDYRDLYPGLREPNEIECPDETYYVASAETDGWVAYEDLPKETLYRLAERFGWSSYRRPTGAQPQGMELPSHKETEMKEEWNFEWTGAKLHYSREPEVCKCVSCGEEFTVQEFFLVIVIAEDERRVPICELCAWDQRPWDAARADLLRRELRLANGEWTLPDAVRLALERRAEAKTRARKLKDLLAHLQDILDKNETRIARVTEATELAKSNSASIKAAVESGDATAIRDALQTYQNTRDKICRLSVDDTTDEMPF